MTTLPPTLILQEVPVIFKNFSGEKGQYNKDGDRTFSVIIDNPDYAEELLELGWAVRPLRDDDGEVYSHHLPVKVNYGGRQPPRIEKVSMANQKMMFVDEPNVSMLDWLPIAYVDVSLNPYLWSVQGKTGIKAYLNSMYAVIEEDELDLKWAGFGDEPPFDEDEM